MFKLFTRKKVVPDNQAIIAAWEKAGKPSPPPHIIKQLAIEEYRKKYNLQVLIETGTFLGDMVAANMNVFSKIYSIELSQKLFKKATKRFKNNNNVFLFNGDSAAVLPQILSTINEPCLFWLDGHYSGGITAKGSLECPVREELKCILAHNKNHVILIDDARLFNGTNDYPSATEIKNIITASGKQYTVAIDTDIIRLTN
jgi:hypothetical protein